MLKKKKYEDMRSCWEFGEAEECRRGLMLGMGYTEEEIAQMCEAGAVTNKRIR